MKYLGIKNITEMEKEVFRNKWDDFYHNNRKDFIRTVWILYSEARK